MIQVDICSSWSCQVDMSSTWRARNQPKA